MLLAISDAGTWLRAHLDYDGRTLKGLSNVALGPLLGNDGKPLLDDEDRDSEGMTLVDGDTGQGTAFVSFERRHRIVRYPFTADKFGPPTGTVPLPPAAKRMDANRGIEAITVIRSGRLKGTLVAFSERLTDKNGNLTGWLIGGPMPGTITLKRLDGFDITDTAALPDGGIVILERRFSYSEGIQMRIRRVAASRAQARRTDPGRGSAGGDRQLEHRQYGGDRRASPRVRRNHHHIDVRRQFQPTAADADHAVHAARREIRRSCSVCKLAAVVNTPCQTATILEEAKTWMAGSSPAMTEILVLRQPAETYEAEACAPCFLAISRFSRRAFKDSSSSPALSR